MPDIVCRIDQRVSLSTGQLTLLETASSLVRARVSSPQIATETFKQYVLDCTYYRKLDSHTILDNRYRRHLDLLKWFCGKKLSQRSLVSGLHLSG